MPQRVRITGKSDVRYSNEAIDAQVDRLGNLMTREGALPGLNETYEGIVTVGNSPVTCDFNNDSGRNAMEGWIINDGDGDIQVDYSRDGISFGDKFTVKKGESVDLLRLDIDKLRITRVSADASYRVFLV